MIFFYGTHVSFRFKAKSQLTPNYCLNQGCSAFELRALGARIQDIFEL